MIFVAVGVDEGAGDGVTETTTKPLSHLETGGFQFSTLRLLRSGYVEESLLPDPCSLAVRQFFAFPLFVSLSDLTFSRLEKEKLDRDLVTLESRRSGGKKKMQGSASVRP